MSEITPNIYLGSLETANNEEWLKQNGITHIVGMIDSQTKFQNINYLIFSNVNDSPKQNIILYFKQIFNFINNALNKKGKVLIHCHAGVSRSTTIVMAYLMYKYKINLLNSYSLVKKKRPIINPNYGFILQLKVFEGMIKRC